MIHCLTYGGDDEEDEERVHHRDDGSRESRDHLLERLEPSEESDHAERPHEAQDGDGDVDRPERHEGQEHHQSVEHAPRVAQEGPQPVSVDVDSKFRGEDDREEEIKGVHDAPKQRLFAILVRNLTDELGLH